MTPHALKALKASIATWWRRAYVKPEYPSSGTCALCLEFRYIGDYWSSCLECPVKMYTRRKHCEKTPYYAYLTAWDRGFKKEIQMVRAKKEFEFLVSLLPKGKTWTAPDKWVWYSEEIR